MTVVHSFNYDPCRIKILMCANLKDTESHLYYFLYKMASPKQVTGPGLS